MSDELMILQVIFQYAMLAIPCRRISDVLVPSIGTVIVHDSMADNNMVNQGINFLHSVYGQQIISSCTIHSKII